MGLPSRLWWKFIDLGQRRPFFAMSMLTVGWAGLVYAADPWPASPVGAWIDPNIAITILGALVAVATTYLRLYVAAALERHEKDLSEKIHELINDLRRELMEHQHRRP